MRRAAQAAKELREYALSVSLESRASGMAQLEPTSAIPEPPWPSGPVLQDWERFERYPNYLAAHIVAGLLETEGVPTIIEAVTPVTGVETSALWVPKKLVHRARWILAWPAPTDRELIFLATGEFQTPSRSRRSNSALLTDAYTSPLRAQRGAAKRGR